MIPIALSGDRSYNKDNIRRYVLEGNRVIPGSSTIHFDEVSKNKIFAAIDEANFNDIKLKCPDSSRLIIVDHYKLNDLSEINTFHDDFVANGYEGAVIRDAESKYKPGSRGRD
jgi:hypothetical protein